MRISHRVLFLILLFLVSSQFGCSKVTSKPSVGNQSSEAQRLLGVWKVSFDLHIKNDDVDETMPVPMGSIEFLASGSYKIKVDGQSFGGTYVWADGTITIKDRIKRAEPYNGRIKWIASKTFSVSLDRSNNSAHYEGFETSFEQLNLKVLSITMMFTQTDE